MYCTVYSPERITKFSGQTSFLSSLTDYETPQVLTVSHSEVDLCGEPLLQGPVVAVQQVDQVGVTHKPCTVHQDIL